MEFSGFLCEGGFKASARLHNGKIEKFRITSLLGNKCIVKVDIHELVMRNEKIIPLGDNKYQFNIKKGEELNLTAENQHSCEEIPFDNSLLNCYGLNKAHDKLLEILDVTG